MNIMISLRHYIACTVTALALFLGGGCATLPDGEKLAGQAPAQGTPTIVSAQGVLSPAQSRAIIARLQAGAKATDVLQRHEAVLEMVGGPPLVKGNRVTLLTDGRSSYAAIFHAIEAATDNINVEMYKIEDDQEGHKFAEWLLKKQAEGVHVNLMYDRIGSLNTPASFFNRMRQAGIDVVEVNPIDASKGAVVAADHRKMVIVDGKLLITGGINISQVYSSTVFQKEKKEKPSVPWRDTDIEIEGPVVAEFQRLFLDLWLQQKGPGLSVRRYFPRLEEKGAALVRAVGSAPGENNRLNYVSYLSALTFAEHSIHLTSAYFIPDDSTLDALTAAARRGVDVKIIVPSISDSAWALWAMRYNYSELLKSGVKLYERRKALLHAKTAVVDGVWSTVGSTNFDSYSLSRNYEVNAVILGGRFGSEMEEMFANDLKESGQIRPEKWQKRSLLEKSRELLAHLFSHLM
jgi:cardiolipin synthase A/B